LVNLCDQGDLPKWLAHYLVAVGAQVRQRFEQSSTWLRPLMVNKLIELRSHPEIGDEERVAIVVLKKTKLSFFDRKFALVFEVLL